MVSEVEGLVGHQASFATKNVAGRTDHELRDDCCPAGEVDAIANKPIESLDITVDSDGPRSGKSCTFTVGFGKQKSACIDD